MYSSQEFQLIKKQLIDNSFKLDLYQCQYRRAGENKRKPAKFLASISGKPLTLLRLTLYEILKQNGYDPRQITSRKSPYVLKESSGCLIALLIQTINPLKSDNHILSIIAGLKSMSDEEIHYWFAKVHEGDYGSLALLALRVLFKRDNHD